MECAQHQEDNVVYWIAASVSGHDYHRRWAYMIFEGSFADWLAAAAASAAAPTTASGNVGITLHPSTFTIKTALKGKAHVQLSVLKWSSAKYRLHSKGAGRAFSQAGITGTYRLGIFFGELFRRNFAVFFLQDDQPQRLGGFGAPPKPVWGFYLCVWCFSVFLVALNFHLYCCSY